MTMSLPENRVNQSMATELARRGGSAEGLFQRAEPFDDLTISFEKADRASTRSMVPQAATASRARSRSYSVVIGEGLNPLTTR